MNTKSISVRDRVELLLPLVFSEWPALAAIVVLSICAAVLTAFAPWPLKLIVDVALGNVPAPFWLTKIGAEPTDIIVACTIASILIVVALNIIGGVLTLLWTASGQRMMYRLAGNTHRKVLSMSYKHYQQHNVGDLISRISTDSWCVYGVTAQLLVTPIRQLLIIATTGYASWILSPSISVLILAATPGLAFSLIYFGRKIKSRSTDLRGAQAAVATFSHQTLSHLPLVHAFQLRERNTGKFIEYGDLAIQSNVKAKSADQQYALLNVACLAIGSSLVLLFGGRSVAAGSITLGSLLALIVYAESLRKAFASLLECYGRVRWIEASIDRILELSEPGENLSDRPNLKSLVLHAPTTGGADISFQKVRFSYSSEKPTLRDIDLTIGNGEVVAIVGATGSGKSTLVSLLPRFIDPDSGKILIDGQSIHEVTIESLRSKISFVSQDSLLLPVSIAENIAFGLPGASMDQVIQAAKLAQAHKFVTELEDGYNTLVSEKGSSLSGGQKQRISIARAILRDAPILVLDEPTSALDQSTENLFLDDLITLSKAKTTLIIAHRLNTIKFADRIIVLKDGAIEEIGRHDQLLDQRGEYWSFYHSHLDLEKPR